MRVESGPWIKSSNIESCPGFTQRGKNGGGRFSTVARATTKYELSLVQRQIALPMHIGMTNLREIIAGFPAFVTQRIIYLRIRPFRGSMEPASDSRVWAAEAFVGQMTAP